VSFESESWIAAGDFGDAVIFNGAISPTVT
jgi:hypothetical protein